MWGLMTMMRMQLSLTNSVWGHPRHPNGQELMENTIMPDDIETEISRAAQKLMAVTGAESEREAILGAVRFQLRSLENPKPLLSA